MFRFPFSWSLAAGALIIAATLADARSSSAAEQERYAIGASGAYTYLPSPLSPGIPGGTPSAYELDFGVSGFFSVEYDETTAPAA